MKKRMLAAMLLAMTMLTACQADISNDVSATTTAEGSGREEGMESQEGAKNEERKEKSTSSTGELTVADIKQKYAANDVTGENQEIMPLYNVAEDQAFDFTFQIVEDYLPISDSELVTVHTDKACTPESELATYTDRVENEKGFTITITPVSTALETLYNEKDEEENEHVVWGNAPIYYIAVWYDMESEELKKLEEPIVVPFTIKHEVQAPEVKGVVDANGCFSLQWEPVEGAEEYRIYNLIDGNQWAGHQNGPVDSAETGYYNCSLLYMTSTTDTKFADFTQNGKDSLVLHERSVTGKLYCIGQNYSVCGDYYVSAVVDGKESGFASAVETADLKIPYGLSDEDNIMFEDYESENDLPLTLDVVNIDGSVTARNVYYTFHMKETYVDGWEVPEYDYQIEGTSLTGCVSMKITEDMNYPEHVGSLSPVGNIEPENDINKQPDADVEPIIEAEDDSINMSNLFELQKENTKKHTENGEKQSTKAVDEKYIIFADSAEEEWLALNLVNGETEISLEAFPGLQQTDALEDVFYKVYYQNPYILGIRKFGYDYKDMIFRIEYAYSQEEMEQMRQEIYDESEKILSETVTEGMSDEEKRMVIYKYLEENCEYDYAALEEAEKNNYKKTADDEHEYAFNTYGIIVEKKGVCQSYAYAYKLLCNMSGLECNVMTGYLDGSLPHAWNVVKIDGEWYQTDSTNNEKVAGIPYFLYNSNTETAEMTGFSRDKLYGLDEELAEYESTNQEYEYYFANSRYAEDLDEYVNVLGGLVEEEGENICIRYSGEKPDTSEFEEAVVEVFYRKNLEDKLADMTYKISNNFIILSNGK